LSRGSRILSAVLLLGFLTIGASTGYTAELPANGRDLLPVFGRAAQRQTFTLCSHGRLYCTGVWERLLDWRHCARPAFALDRLSVVLGNGNRPERVRYTLPRHKRGNWVGPGRTRKSMRPGASGVIELTAFEFLDRLAALIPPPRRHRHRYHGVFAPNHPLRQAVTAVAVGNIGKQ